MLTSKSHWDRKKQESKNCPESTDINARIASWKTKFNEYSGRYKRGEIDFDLEEARTFVTAGTAAGLGSRKVTLETVAEAFIKDKRRTVNADTISHYETMLGDIKEYETFVSHKHKLKEISTTFYLDYGLYLIEERDNINSTTNRKIGRIRTLMEWAFEKDLIDTQKYAKTYYFKDHESGRFPLSDDDIQALSEVETDNPYQRNLLDAFLFSCEVGLRVSDLQQLKRHHLQEYKDKDGVINYIDFSQIKGTRANYIPLSNKAMDIIGRQPPGDFVFNFKYSQEVNKELKKLAARAGLDRMVEIVYIKNVTSFREPVKISSVISFHWGRNTCITNLLARGLPAVFVQQNAGHGDIKTTMKYSKQDDVTRWKETLKIQNKIL